MNNNIGEQLNIVINNLAEKLGVAASKLYPLLIKQAHIEGIISLLYIVTGVMLIICSVYLINRYYFQTIEIIKYGEAKKVSRSEDWDELHVVFWVVIALCILMGILVVVCSVSNCITALTNPEWYAIKMILNQI